MEARRPAWFALGSPQALCFRFSGANFGPGISGLEARRPAWFALGSRKPFVFGFPGANLRPGISGLAARRPAWFALGSPQDLCFRFQARTSGRDSRPAGRHGRARLPQALCFRFPGANLRPSISEIWFSGRHGSRSTPHKPFVFGLGANSGGNFGARRPAKSSPLTLVFRPGEQILLIRAEMGQPAFSKARFAPPPRPLRLRFGSKIFTQNPRRRPGRGLLPLPANPLLRPGSKIQDSRTARAGRSQGTVCPSREPCSSVPGANSSHKFRATGRGRPPFSGGLGLLPVPTSLYSSVPGSKFFTQIPRRRPGPAAFPRRGLLPLPANLAAPFREQNLHTDSAPPPGAGRFPKARFAPLPANPCSSVRGAKNLHTDSAPPPGLAAFFWGAVCSPVPREPFRPVPGANSSHKSALAHKHLAGLSARCFLSSTVPAGLHSLMQIPCGAVQSPAGPSPAGHF